MQSPEPLIIGISPAIQKIRQLVQKVSTHDLNVLITGESGVGKKLVARSLHAHSQRKDKPFVKVNCAAIPFDLLESVLFGFEKGDHSGREKSKKGKFELAGEGTIFLDDIDEVPIPTQSKLLQVLQDRKYYRVGGHASLEARARIIATSNEDLAPEINADIFRAELFYLLSTVIIHVPPLRERKEDILPLVEYFNRSLSQERKQQPTPPLPPDLIDLFYEYHWPGNVRELYNYLQRHRLLNNTQEIKNEIQSSRQLTTWKEKAPDTGQSLESNACQENAAQDQEPTDTPFPSLKEVRDQMRRRVERDIIEKILQETGWNRKAAAIRLKISYRTLLYKIKELNITQSKDQ
ncbi:MAG: sigma-54 dependent transcriptional regulator [Desulfohalobiaceae bacterium]|nr:sigma-54 dependent transcriptional regulator [Desulfohalobiaceae bacterium]